MTAYFVSRFHSETQCRNCKESPQTLRKFCALHLEKAKAKWRAFYAERRSMGRCIHCDRKGHLGECRCAIHKKANQAKCREWSLQNKDYLAFRHAFEKAWFSKLGICSCCRRAPLSPTSTRNCVGCRARANAAERKRRPSVVEEPARV